MRLIDVNVLKEWVENWFTKNRFYHPYAKNNNIPITELYDILEQMPSAQPKKGKWIYDYDKDEAPFFMQGWKCSACGKRQTYGEAPFCMYCGAEMEHSDGYEERQRKLRELIERDET